MTAVTPSFCQPSAELPQVQLLIDVSGSMKQSDPHNLRIPATKVLINLLKDKANLTIITFAGTAKTLLANRPVLKDYDNEFVQKSNLVSSAGALTNINAAIEQTTAAWVDNDKAKIMVILTDGKMDLGSAEKSNAETQKMLSAALPALKKQKIHVYTVGLSAQADEKLLRELSEQTNAIYQRIDTAGDIPRIFYNIFSAAIETQGVPIKRSADGEARKIDIDDKITDLSLIFEIDDANSSIEVIKPNNSVLDKEDQQTQIQKISNYLFIKVDNPMAGTWQIKGKQQAVERAIILTNLQLVSTPMQGRFFNNEQLLWQAHLATNGKLLSTPILLSDMKMQLQIENSSQQKTHHFTQVQEENYQLDFILNTTPGLNEVKITASNRFFTRQNQSLIEVLNTPFRQEVNESGNYEITLDNDLVNEQATFLLMRNQEKTIALPLAKSNSNSWSIPITTICNSQTTHAASYQTLIKSQTKDGRNLTIIMPGQEITCLNREEYLASSIAKLVFPVSKKAISPAVKKAAPVKKVSAGKKPATVKKVIDNHEKPQPVTFSFKFFIGCLVLLLLGWLVFMVVRKHLAKKKLDQLREQ